MASDSRRVLFFALVLVVNEINVRGQGNKQTKMEQPKVNSKVVNNNGHFPRQPGNDPQPADGVGKFGKVMPRANFGAAENLQNAKFRMTDDTKPIHSKFRPLKSSHPNANGLPLAGQGGARKSSFKLAETVECAEDVRKHCNTKVYRNNFAVMDCLQSEPKVISFL